MVVGPTPALRTPRATSSGCRPSGRRLDFALTSQDGATVALRDFRGRVLAVAFIYTSCPDVCPLLTEKMAQVQDELGPDFGPRVAFVSITVDPENDTPAALKAYAESHGANLAGWSFLTGAPPVISEVAQRYGVAVIAHRRWAGGAHLADHAGGQAWHDACPISRLPVRPRGVPARSYGAAARALTRIRDRVVDTVSRLPARVQTKLLVAFLAMAALLMLMGAVGLQALHGVNRQTEELIRLQRKIAAFRQVQHDTTAQLYGVTSALLAPDEQVLQATLRQLTQFGYDLDRLQYVASDEVELLARVRGDYDRFIAIVTRVVELAGAGRVGRGAHRCSATRPGHWPTAWSASPTSWSISPRRR